jgi:membrane protease YdiL (CAAX protease family)
VSAAAAPAREPAVVTGERFAAGPVVILLLVLVAAIGVRRGVAGAEVATSPPAGIAFAALLGLAAAVATWQPSWLGLQRSGPATVADTARRRDRAQYRAVPAILVGTGGAAVLCAWPLVDHLLSPGGALGVGRFPAWAIVVTSVAITEEAFLRGALWRAAARWRGDWVALATTTLAFAALHVPFYGIGSIPVNLAAGLLLGGLRQVSGGVTAPATAHVVANLAGWWLR